MFGHLRLMISIECDIKKGPKYKYNIKMARFTYKMHKTRTIHNYLENSFYICRVPKIYLSNVLFIVIKRKSFYVD